MATNSMMPSMYTAPQGLDELLVADEPAIEVEIEDPESLKIAMGGVEIELEPEEETGDEAFDANLAEHMDENELQKVASDLMGEVDGDIASRKDWVEMFVRVVPIGGGLVKRPVQLGAAT